MLCVALSQRGQTGEDYVVRLMLFKYAVGKLNLSVRSCASAQQVLLGKEVSVEDIGVAVWFIILLGALFLYRLYKRIIFYRF